MCSDLFSIYNVWFCVTTNVIAMQIAQSLSTMAVCWPIKCYRKNAIGSPHRFSRARADRMRIETVSQIKVKVKQPFPKDDCSFPVKLNMFPITSLLHAMESHLTRCYATTGVTFVSARIEMESNCICNP